MSGPEDNEYNLVPCSGSCKQLIDPNLCACGEEITDNYIHDGHTAVPMGCECYREKKNG